MPPAAAPTRPTPSTTPPPADARVVGRPRRMAVVLWGVPTVFAALGIIGLLIAGEPGPAAAVLLPLLAFAGVLAYVARGLVVVDGDLLHHRTLPGWRGPVDLDRLTYAGDPPAGAGRSGARTVVLVDRDGREVRIDGVNIELSALYRELGEHLGQGGRLPTGALRDLVDQHR